MEHIEDSNVPELENQVSSVSLENNTAEHPSTLSQQVEPHETECESVKDENSKSNGEISDTLSEWQDREILKCINCGKTTNRVAFLKKDRRIVQEWMLAVLREKGAEFNMRRKYICNRCRCQLDYYRKKYKQKDVDEPVSVTESSQESETAEKMGNDNDEATNSDVKQDGPSTEPPVENTRKRNKYPREDVHCVVCSTRTDKKISYYKNRILFSSWMIPELETLGVKYDPHRKWVCNPCWHQVRKLSQRKVDQTDSDYVKIDKADVSGKIASSKFETERSKSNKEENDNVEQVAKLKLFTKPAQNVVVETNTNPDLSVGVDFKQGRTSAKPDVDFEQDSTTSKPDLSFGVDVEQDTTTSKPDLSVGVDVEQDTTTTKPDLSVGVDIEQDTTSTITIDDAKKCIKCDKDWDHKKSRKISRLPTLVTQSIVDYMREHHMTFIPTRRYLCYMCTGVLNSAAKESYGYKGNTTKSTKKEMKVLKFANPGKFMEDFNPETSARELRKVNRKIIKQTVKKNQMYDETGLLLNDSRDLCDCLDTACPGCHFPCSKCDSEKCGGECRCNRKYVYEKVEVEGSNLSWEFFL